MTGTASNQTSPSGIGRVEFQQPEFPEPDEPIVMHDDFLQIAGDTLGSYQAVCVLMAMLAGETDQPLDTHDRAGLAVLLEGVKYRLELAVEGLAVMGRSLGIPEASSLAQGL